MKKLAYLILILISSALISCESDDVKNSTRRNSNGDIMQPGVELSAPTPQPEKYKHDLIHPSAKYIKDGFAGHDWWMVATPYYNYNSSIENPILYYGDSREGGLPPLEWTPTVIVTGTPSKGGYNSDACLYFEGSKLWVFWRENHTADCLNNGMRRATFGVSTKDGFNFTKKKIYAGVESADWDNQMCPIVTDMNGKLQLYGCHYEFKPKRQSRGLAIWDIENNDLEKNQFTLTKNVTPQYYDGFDFWHFDVFKHNDKFYCVVTPEKGNEILLGESSDAENFKFWSTPLLSTSVCGASYMYKPCAMVLNDILYLWHPKRMPNKTNKIHMSQMNFKQVIEKLNKMEGI